MNAASRIDWKLWFIGRAICLAEEVAEVDKGKMTVNSKECAQLIAQAVGCYGESWSGTAHRRLRMNHGRKTGRSMSSQPCQTPRHAERAKINVCRKKTKPCHQQGQVEYEEGAKNRLWSSKPFLSTSRHRRRRLGVSATAGRMRSDALCPAGQTNALLKRQNDVLGEDEEQADNRLWLESKLCATQ